MHRLWKRGVALLVCVWLLGGLGSMRIGGADPLLDARMERFPRAIPLPEISLPDVEGVRVSLRSFKGQVILVNFWTTW